MNNILDNRNNQNWPAHNFTIGTAQITAQMAGQNGFNDVTTGVNGSGVLTDSTGNSYNIELPGLISQLGTLYVTFQRL